jgi:hypothetical protein
MFWVCVYIAIHGSDHVKCDVWVKLWFVCEFCEKWVIIMKVVFWWIGLYNCVGEVVIVMKWIRNSVMVVVMSQRVERGNMVNMNMDTYK